jgi:hypothetical protein
MNIKTECSKPRTAFYQHKQEQQKQKWKLVVTNMKRMSRTEKGRHGKESSKGLRKKRIEIDRVSRERKGKSVDVGEVGRKSRLKIERERE